MKFTLSYKKNIYINKTRMNDTLRVEDGGGKCDKAVSLKAVTFVW